MIFELKDAEFVELNKLMKLMNWVESGGQANALISQGEVEVNGKVDTRKRKKLRKGELVEFAGQQVEIC